MSLKPLLLFLFLTISTLLSASSSTKLREYRDKLSEIDSKLDQISKEILKEKKAIFQITKELKVIDRELFKDRKQYEVKKKAFEKLQANSDKLLLKQQALRDKIATTSAKLISLSIMSNSDSNDNLNSVILDEVFHILNKKNRELLKEMDSELKERNKKINKLKEKIDVLMKSIEDVENKKKRIKAKKKEREILFKKLEKKKKEYKNRLREIARKQKKIKEEIARAKQESKRGQQRSSKSVKVKDSSSYHREAVKKYRGRKTISPLKEYKVITKFGTYIDPIYKFKIFSSSVVLKPLKPNSIVRNIFNGRVILIKEDKTLGKFVMIEHDNGLQTMLAHLDSFSPFIKKGKRIKKGTVVGRVSKKLYFEVMKNNYRIDPLEVIE